MAQGHSIVNHFLIRNTSGAIILPRSITERTVRRNRVSNGPLQFQQAVKGSLADHAPLQLGERSLRLARPEGPMDMKWKQQRKFASEHCRIVEEARMPWLLTMGLIVSRFWNLLRGQGGNESGRPWIRRSRMAYDPWHGVPRRSDGLGERAQRTLSAWAPLRHCAVAPFNRKFT